MSGGFGKRSIASLLAIGVLAVSAFTVVGSGALASGTGSAETPTVGATAPRAAEAAAAKPRWQVLSGVKLTESNPAPRQLGWASGRVWAGFDAVRKFDDGFLTLVSLRAAGRALTSAVKSEMVRVRGPFLITGSGLLYHTSGSVNGRIVSDAELRTARLLANGRLGATREVPEEPEKRPPQEYHPGVVETIEIGGRTVWLLAGIEFADNGSVRRIFLWICCSAADELVDLTPLVRSTKNVHSYNLGLDAKGRLWLAWSNPVRMVELDPITLAPRSARFAVQQTPDKFAFACAAACRVVGSDGDSIYTWSAGERDWTRIVRAAKTTRVHTVRGWRTISDPQSWPNLLAASYRGGDLQVAYYPYAATYGPDGKTGVQTITVVRGDARGKRARSVGSLVIPSAFNQRDSERYVLFNGAHATFVPGGLVALGTYVAFRRSRVIAAFLPLGR